MGWVVALGVIVLTSLNRWCGVLGQGWGHSCPLRAPSSMTGSSVSLLCCGCEPSLDLFVEWAVSQSPRQECQGASGLLMVAAAGHSCYLVSTGSTILPSYYQRGPG